MIEGIIIGLLILSIGLIAKWSNWKNKAITTEMQLNEIKKIVKKKNSLAVDLDIATTTQIFQELSKRGRVILLIPHQKNNMTFVETLAAQMSPTQTMDMLKVAYAGIAGQLQPPDDEE